MNEKEFNKLIDKNKFQVFLFSSPLSFPLLFVKHFWIVTSQKGNIQRWDVLEYKNLYEYSDGHLYKNIIKPTFGLGINPFTRKNIKFVKNYEGKLINSISGNNISLAHKMCQFMDKNYSEYKLKNEYSYYPGPNSNSFIQWIIDKFPESGFKLSWSAVGKNYWKK